jgi:hypothetical protein
METAKLTAEADFSRARLKAVLSQMQNFMHTDRDKLLSFNDVEEILKPKNQIYRGSQVVPVNLIVGSEGRYRDFNKYFFPKSEHLRNRWQRVDEARIKDRILPPIQLYEIGGVYFVRDGNHRVSVARSQGVEYIDAEVTSLTTMVRINPSMTEEELKLSLIEYEKNIFYVKTGFAKLQDKDLNFSSPGSYDIIYNHILVHKYFLNQDREGEIPFSEAMVSWYKNVYSPVIKIIEEQWILAGFPGKTPGDLYIWIVKYWDLVKQEYGAYSLDQAAGDFSKKYRQNRGSFFRFLRLLADRLAAKLQKKR